MYRQVSRTRGKTLSPHLWSRANFGVDAGVGLEGDTTLGSFQIRNDSFEAGKSQIVMSLKAGLISKGGF